MLILHFSLMDAWGVLFAPSVAEQISAWKLWKEPNDWKSNTSCQQALIAGLNFDSN